jgi:glycosyltransferase involved in cell wall biosynthesis
MGKRAKVLHIHGSAFIGGTEMVAFNLLKKIDKKRFEIKVLFDCERGDINPYYENEKISILNSEGILKDINFIRSFNPDIVHLYGLRVNLKWRTILWFMGFRNIIGAVRGLTNTEKEGFWRVKLDVLTSCFLKKYITNAVNLSNYLKTKGFPEEKLEVIYNGIETDKFNTFSEGEKERLREAFGIPENSIVISCVANLRPVKGHVVLIDALSNLQDLNFSVLMIGDGRLRERLGKYSDEKGLARKVRFLGQRLDIPELLAVTDIFVLSSLSEGMPYSIMEAMASGLPIVSTDVGGISELVNDGETGFLVPPRAPQSLAEKLHILMCDKELGKTMGMKGRMRIKNNFTFESMVRKTELLYESLINN